MQKREGKEMGKKVLGRLVCLYASTPMQLCISHSFRVGAIVLVLASSRGIRAGEKSAILDESQ